MTIPIAPIAGIIATPAIQQAIPSLLAGQYTQGMAQLGYIVGIVDSSGKFDFNLMKKNVMPMIAGVLVHKLASMAGINRLLAKAKVPYLRV